MQEILISFTFEARYTTLVRKLEAENSEIPDTEAETVEVDTIQTPEHEGEQTTIPTQEDSKTQSSGNVIEPETGSTNPSGQEDNTDLTIPSVITKNPTNLEPSLYVFIAIGNFFNPIGLPYAYFISLFSWIYGRRIPPYYIYFTVKVTYRRLRGLQEDIEEKEEQANGIRITFDEDPDIKYNCTMNVDQNAEIVKATLDPSSIQSDDDSYTQFIISSLVNKTINEDGIQKATEDILSQKIYFLNNTVLEENGLKFKLTGEATKFPDEKEITLFFDEKGNGEIKNATCNAAHQESNIYVLDCLALTNINAHINGINGKTSNDQEQVIVYMKPESDQILNTGSNYMGLYNRGSSSGLSGGAIAGIVIACVAALLAIAIGAMLCRKTNVPAPFQESTLGVNTSNITD